MTAPDDVRARFEWFVRRELAGELPLDRDPSGEYIAAKTRGALRSWQATHADLSGEVRELVEALKLARDYAAYVQGEPDDLAVMDAALAKHTHQEKP